MSHNTHTQLQPRPPEQPAPSDRTHQQLLSRILDGLSPIELYRVTAGIEEVIAAQQRSFDF